MQGGEVVGGTGGAGWEGLAEAEVGEEGAAVGGEEEVSEAEVAMGEADAVGGGEGFGDGAEQGDELAGTEWSAALEQDAERPGGDVRADDDPRAVDLTHLGEPHDVRVLEPAREGQVTPERFRGGHDGRRYALDHHRPPGGEVAREPDRTGRPGAEQPPDPISRDLHVWKAWRKPNSPRGRCPQGR